VKLASEGRGRGLHRSGDPPPALARFPPAAELLDIDLPSSPPEPDALGLGSGLTGANTLTNPLTFLLGDPGEDRGEQISYRPAGIEPRLLVTHDADARRSELPHVSGHRPDPFSTQAIERPDQQNVEFTAMGGREERRKLVAVSPCSAHGLAIKVHKLEPEAGRPTPQLAFLILCRLVTRTYPQVQGSATGNVEERHREPSGDARTLRRIKRSSGSTW